MNTEKGNAEDSAAPHCYLAFCIGEWFAKALRYLDREAFDSRELGRHVLTLTCESMGLDDRHSDIIARVRDVAVSVCVSFSGAGGGGPAMLEQVRIAIVTEVSR